MNADGSGKRQLTFDTFTDFNASWSPDGREIAFRSRRNNNSDIYIMNDDGTNVRQIRMPDSRWSEPPLSHRTRRSTMRITGMTPEAERTCWGAETTS